MCILHVYTACVYCVLTAGSLVRVNTTCPDRFEVHCLRLQKHIIDICIVQHPLKSRGLLLLQSIATTCMAIVSALVLLSL